MSAFYTFYTFCKHNENVHVFLKKINIIFYRFSFLSFFFYFGIEFPFDISRDCSQVVNIMISCMLWFFDGTKGSFDK